MATLVCINIGNLPDKLEITMPGMGVLQMINDKIDGIPRPSEYVLKGLNSLMPAMAPIYTIIKVLDVIVALTNCIKAIPMAIITLNPSKIFECVEKLIEAFAALIPMIPPLAYVRMIVDIVIAIRVLVDDLLNVLVEIDKEISRIKNLIANAVDNDDTVSVAIGECAKENLNKNVAGLIEMFTVVGKIMAIVFNILDTIAVLLPPGTQKELNATKESILGLDVNISASDYPPVGPIKDGLFGLRTVLQTIEQVGKAVLGLRFSLAAPPFPTDFEFENP